MNEENANALNNLIQNIQEKMNESSNDNTNQNNSFDFSNFFNIMNTNNTNSNADSSSNENYNSSNANQESSSSEASDFSFDPSILLKAQKILSAMNSKSPKKDLLLSLKPFLRKSRQDKMSEYMTILNVLTVLDNFKNNKGSD